MRSALSEPPRSPRRGSLGVARVVLQGGGARLGRTIALSAGEPLAAPLMLVASGAGGATAAALTAAGSRLCTVNAAGDARISPATCTSSQYDPYIHYQS